MIWTTNASPGRNAPPYHLKVIFEDFKRMPLLGAVNVTVRDSLGGIRAGATVGGVASGVGGEASVAVAGGGGPGVGVSGMGVGVSVGNHISPTGVTLRLTRTVGMRDGIGVGVSIATGVGR